jgi:hypothetical protein
MAEKKLNPNDDHTVLLTPGMGCWISVQDNKGDKLVVRLGCDTLTGMFKAQVFNPGEEDTVPVEEIRLDF